MAYCLMNNHFHLLLEISDPNLSAGMHRLQSAYARAFNERHDRVGHVFQGRYGSVRARTDEQVRAAAVYLARNPVDAGLCGRPEDWQWSSLGFIARGVRPAWVAVDRLLALFDEDPDRATATYLECAGARHLVPGTS
jgi:hypothetical protein